MKAIVIGCGRVGATLARTLVNEGWEVTVIELDEENLSRLGPDWRQPLVLGHGMDAKVLEEAGVEEADALIAATDGDNTNLVIAQIAKRRFEIGKVVVRVLDPMRAQWYEDQGLLTVCPTQKAIEMLEAAVVAEAAS